MPSPTDFRATPSWGAFALFGLLTVVPQAVAQGEDGGAATSRPVEPVVERPAELPVERSEASVRDYVWTAPAEEAFLSLDWHTTFASAVLEADRVDRPVFLWTMNGHPLGCT